MRYYIQFDPVTYRVTSILSSSQQITPLPANVVELLSEPNAIILGKVYNPSNGSYTDWTPTKLELEITAKGKYAEWLQWKTTREEAQTRGLAAGVIAKLQAKEDAAWVTYRDALLAWANA